MKKFLIMLLTLVLAFAMTFSLVACDDTNKKDESEKEEPEETTTETIPETTESNEPVAIPEGYELYSDDVISFAYPSTWHNNAGSLMHAGTGNNINVGYEEMSDFYSTMDVASFNSELKPMLEQAGLTIKNPSVEQLTNDNDTKCTKIRFTTQYSGVTMTQTMFIVAAGGYNYVITVTEVAADDALIENVYKTLDIIEK